MSRQVDVKALISHIVRGDGADKCRICMGDTSEGQVYLGDTVMMDNDRPVTLSELLEVITGVEVVNTALPNAICTPCMKHVSGALPFFRMCWESSRKWNEITDFFCQYDVPENTKNLYIIFDELGPRALNDNWKCPTLPPVNTKAVLKNFKNRLYRLKAYKKRQEKEINVIRQAELNLKSDEVSDIQSKNIMICPQCKCVFVKTINFIRHIRNLNMTICSYCHSIFHIGILKDHLLENHGVKTISCETCSESFKNKSLLLKHVKLNHYKRPNFCNECKKSFPNYNGLAAHMPVHTSQMCLGCNKKFTNKCCFKKHSCSIPVAAVEIYICDYCSAEYKNKNALRVHIVAQHLVGKLHQCDKCGKKFLSRAALLEHDNIHERVEDRYVCTICDFKYSSRRGYQKHLKKHNETLRTKNTKLKKCHCELCDFQCNRKNNLFVHLREKHGIVGWEFIVKC